MPRSAQLNGLFIPVVLEEQIQPGTFEFAMTHPNDALDPGAVKLGWIRPSNTLQSVTVSGPPRR